MSYASRQLPSHGIRPSSGFGGHSSNNASTSTQSSILQARINEKKVELENLRQLRDLSAGLAGQMQQLEDKLGTLSSGTEAVAAVLGNWQQVLRAIYMASAKIPKPKDAEGEEEEAMALPQTLVRIPIQQAEAVQKEAEAAEAVMEPILPTYTFSQTPPLPGLMADNTSGALAKRSASGMPLATSLDISTLHKPQLVSIFVGERKQEYQVPRGLICGLSEYFNKAFTDRFAEGQKGRLELAEVKPWVFECFIRWLYTQSVFWKKQPAKTAGGSEGESEAEHLAMEQPELDREGLTGDIEGLSDVDLIDPTTWEWAALFELYVFADMHETRRLRNAVVELVQMKCFQTAPRAYLFPSIHEFGLALNRLPTTATLSRLLLDLLLYASPPSTLADADEFEAALCCTAVTATRILTPQDIPTLGIS